MPRRARRTFTPEFKAEVVLTLLRGEQSHAELCRQHQLSPNLLTLWKQTYLDRLALVFSPDERRQREDQRIADLEQLVGRQALELEVLKKASRLLSGPASASGRSS
jgi:transposase-like protein